MRTRRPWVVVSSALSFTLACAGAEIDESNTTFTSGVASASGSASATTATTADTDGSESDSGGGSNSDSMSGGGSMTTTAADTTSGETGPGEGSADAGCVPSDEVCDGVDNDCDLDIDESDPQAGTACRTGLPGACAAGTFVCNAGALMCQANNGGGPEMCNGVDDDCDNQIDQGNPGGGGACNTGLPGVCAAGTNNCSMGGIACVQNVQSSGETCDGEDDNCNGQTDEGNPGGGGGCNTGLQGVCAAGTLTCQNGGLGCVQNVGAGNEACGDGLDNDCNGAVDDGCGCAHDVCAQGGALVNNCSGCVGTICGSDPFCCTNSWDGICVGEVSSLCGQVCQGSCAHSPCVQGGALVGGCDPGGCVTSICGTDPFCCNNSWDGICTGEVGSICGLTC